MDQKAQVDKAQTERNGFGVQHTVGHFEKSGQFIMGFSWAEMQRWIAEEDIERLKAQLDASIFYYSIFRTNIGINYYSEN
jgi:hypothetical protein